MKGMKEKVFLLIGLIALICLSGCTDNNFADSPSDKPENEESQQNQQSHQNKYADGILIYFNPETGVICNDYTSANSINENKTGCMKWYVLDEDDETVDLILDHNTTALIQWVELNSNGVMLGPNEQLMGQLMDDTKNWIGVPIRTDSYTVEQRYADYTISYAGYRARLVTVSDITKVIGRENTKDDVLHNSQMYYRLSDGKSLTDVLYDPTNLNEGKFGWLYDNTANCIKKGCSVQDNNEYEYDKYSEEPISGYWTATTSNNNVGDISAVWCVRNDGTIFNNCNGSVKYKYGIRPVITISKDLIK